MEPKAKERTIKIGNDVVKESQLANMEIPERTLRSIVAEKFEKKSDLYGSLILRLRTMSELYLADAKTFGAIKQCVRLDRTVKVNPWDNLPTDGYMKEADMESDFYKYLHKNDVYCGGGRLMGAQEDDQPKLWKDHVDLYIKRMCSKLSPVEREMLEKLRSARNEFNVTKCQIYSFAYTIYRIISSLQVELDECIWAENNRVTI